MPTHSEKRVLRYHPDQVFDLVADVARYPEFLPWNSAARIRSRDALADGRTVMVADLMISFKVFRERFTSRVVIDKPNGRIDMEATDGPFKHLKSHWDISADAAGSSVEYFVDFEFQNKILQNLIGLVFNEAMRKVVSAFEMRADELYG